MAVAITAWAWGLQQPDPTPARHGPAFSHVTHAGKLSIDCRYCHIYAEEGAHAGIPSAHICMGCHRQVPVDSLQPVRDAYETSKPLIFERDYDVPDFVYFRHDAHLAAGVDCAKCHGDVASMQRVRMHRRQTMSWCIDCHREGHAGIKGTTNCSGCHR